MGMSTHMCMDSSMSVGMRRRTGMDIGIGTSTVIGIGIGEGIKRGGLDGASLPGLGVVVHIKGRFAAPARRCVWEVEAADADADVAVDLVQGLVGPASNTTAARAEVHVLSRAWAWAWAWA